MQLMVASEQTAPPSEVEEHYRLEFAKGQFASNLETARVIWQRYPELVESKEFPSPLLEWFREYEDREPGENIGFCDTELVEAGLLPPPVAEDEHALRLKKIFEQERHHGPGAKALRARLEAQLRHEIDAFCLNGRSRSSHS